MSSGLFEAVERLPAVGILRGCPAKHIEVVTEVAAAAGFAAFEVTLDSPDPFLSIGRLRARFPELVVGAGTVRTVEEAHEAAESGAAFLVSPLLDEAVIAAAAARQLPILPGAATPTEVWRAVQAGAPAVKVFPAVQLGGPGYLRAIRGPLGHPRLVPTGGISTSNARSFLEAGAWALGVGGAVFPREALTVGDAERVGSMASAFVASIT